MVASPELSLLLRRMADPEERSSDPAAISGPAIDQLIDLAGRHGVLSIVLRKLREQAPAVARGDMILRTGQALLLERKAEAVSARLRDAGVAFAIVKGPVFARRLYEFPADRSFTDIDVLIPPAALEAAFEVMRSEGFSLDQKEFWDNSHRDMEFKWTLPENRSVLFELHANLVHYPRLRRRTGFGYEELVNLGGGDPLAPEALLGTAIVHASCGHKFHRLQMIVDVLQAGRRLPDERIGHFVDAAKRTGLAPEAAVTLSLAGRLFEDRRIAMLADRFGDGPVIRIGRRLITPDAVIEAADPHRRGSWIRRKAFRALQYMATRQTPDASASHP